MSRLAHPIYTHTLLATAAVTALRFASVAGAAAAAGSVALGIARYDGVSGDAVPVDVLGVAAVEAGGAIAAGGRIQVGASGKAIAWAGGAVVAIALEAAAADADIISVLLLPAAVPLAGITTLTLAGTVTANRFVDADGDHASAGANAMGVALQGGAAAAVIHVQGSGFAYVTAEEAIAAKGLVEVGTAGKAAAKDSGATVARAVTAAAADGDLILVNLIPN